jgi:formylglycine-generating enzyme
MDISRRGFGLARPADPDMVWLSGGTFRMGSDRHYPEEAPVHCVAISPFWIDRTPVTKRQFRQFIEATGYVTVAEITPDPRDYPGALPHMLKPGSLVFTPPGHSVNLHNWSQWWKFEFGANWRRPNGRGRSNRGLGASSVDGPMAPLKASPDEAGREGD